MRGATPGTGPVRQATVCRAPVRRGQRAQDRSGRAAAACGGLSTGGRVRAGELFRLRDPIDLGGAAGFAGFVLSGGWFVLVGVGRGVPQVSGSWGWWGCSGGWCGASGREPTGLRGGCGVCWWGASGREPAGGLAGWGWVLPPSPPRDCCRPHRTRQGDVELLISGVGGLDPCGAGGGLAAIGEGGRVVEVPTALWACGPLRPQAAGSLPFPLVSSLSASPLRDGSGHEGPATGGARGGARPCGSRHR